MATNDSEMISEVRALTYDEHILSDIQMREILHVCKEEIRADLGDPDFQFYQTGEVENSHDADRALFWFTCIGAKIRVGELGGMDISVADLDAEQASGQEAFWIKKFHNRLQSAGEGGRKPGMTSVNRGTERLYGEDR